jgi:hypothetical protein
MLAPARSRCRFGCGVAHLFTQKGTLQQITCGKLSEAGARGWCLGEGSAGSVLRTQGSSGEGELSRCARGEGLIASNACSGPVPLPLRLWGPRLFTQKETLQQITCGKLSEAGARGWCLGESSAGSVLRAQGSSGEGELSRCARGEGLIASNACSGPVPLPLRLWGRPPFYTKGDTTTDHLRQTF